MNKYNYSDNDLIIKELTEKIILHKKHITAIEQDFLRMNENLNYQFEKYKNTINEKIKLNNIVIDNFTKDIIYRVSIVDNKIDNKIDNNKIDNNKINKIDKNDNNYKQDLMIFKKEYDDKFTTYYDYIQEINYQLIKLKHNTNDKINEFNNLADKINEFNNLADNINDINNKYNSLKTKNNIYFYWIIISFISFLFFQCKY
jgi:hypothetical protein